MKENQSIGFVGGGRVVRFLLEGWQRSGALPGPVRVFEPDEEARDRLIESCPEVELGDLDGVAGSRLIFLAVHPPIVEGVIGSLSGKLRPEAIVVSLVPKARMSALEAGLGTSRIVRMIPNAPSAIGEGYNPVTYNSGIDATVRRELEALFAPWGEAPEVPEDHLEIYAVVTAMGPTYFWYQIQELRNLAVEFGLTPETADRAIGRMVEGTTRCSSCREAPTRWTSWPVRPLREIEPGVVEAIDTRLRRLYGRLAHRPEPAHARRRLRRSRRFRRLPGARSRESPPCRSISTRQQVRSASRSIRRLVGLRFRPGEGDPLPLRDELAEGSISAMPTALR
ncbi:MAG: NAD(P)-binding domain-containing protein [Thermoanaerobaculia bacterium]